MTVSLPSRAGAVLGGVLLCLVTIPSVAAGQGVPVTGLANLGTTSGAQYVAVIPFTNVLGDADINWLGAGIAETLTTDLEQVPGVSVVRWEAVAGESIERTQLDVVLARQLAATRGLKWLVTGAVQSLATDLRITTQILSVDTGLPLMTIKVDGQWEDVFGLQDRLATALSDGFAAVMAVESSEAAALVNNDTARESLPVYRSLEPPASGRMSFNSGPDWVTGYAQTVPLATGATGLSESNLTGFNRFRLTAAPSVGDLRFDVTYEQTATFTQQVAQPGLAVGVVPTGGEWLDLQWTITDREHVQWRHRFDRLQMRWSPTDTVELSVGRQAVSWGTTLFLSPTDPFLPFNPVDPFREFRAGVDAARVTINPTPLSEVDVVVRPTRTLVGEELTVLGRGLMTVQNWELSGWGGRLYDDLAGAVAAAGGLGAFAVRGEMMVRQLAGGPIFRGTIGVDRLLQVGGRDLFLLFEYQRDSLGASGAEDYPRVMFSEPYARGELQVLGRDETAFQATYQLNPLWNLGSLWLWNLNDRSAILAPSFGYSASDDVSVGGGVFFGFGEDEITPPRLIPSEYGLSAPTGYLSLSWYF